MTTQVATPITRLERINLEVAQDFSTRWLEVGALPVGEQAQAIAANVKAMTDEIATRFAAWTKANTGYAEAFEALHGPDLSGLMVDCAKNIDLTVFEDFGSLAAIVYRNADGSWATTFKLNKVTKLKGAKAVKAPKVDGEKGASRKARPVSVDGTAYPSMSAALKAVFGTDTPSSFDSGKKRLETAKHTVVEITS
jgi:hypothetical protein